MPVIVHNKSLKHLACIFVCVLSRFFLSKKTWIDRADHLNYVEYPYRLRIIFANPYCVLCEILTQSLKQPIKLVAVICKCPSLECHAKISGSRDVGKVGFNFFNYFKVNKLIWKHAQFLVGRIGSSSFIGRIFLRDATAFFANHASDAFVGMRAVEDAKLIFSMRNNYC